MHWNTQGLETIIQKKRLSTSVCDCFPLIAGCHTAPLNHKAGCFWKSGSAAHPFNYGRVRGQSSTDSWKSDGPLVSFGNVLVCACGLLAIFPSLHMLGNFCLQIQECHGQLVSLTLQSTSKKWSRNILLSPTGKGSVTPMIHARKLCWFGLPTPRSTIVDAKTSSMATVTSTMWRSTQSTWLMANGQLASKRMVSGRLKMWSFISSLWMMAKRSER